ncbi:MAG: GAF domain-containing sensor histidine kinase [candidate division KSB1 bacterium]|nr:GAF domain-containing sensor histidine kinase [candidate division KSB1 bacterium]
MHNNDSNLTGCYFPNTHSLSVLLQRITFRAMDFLQAEDVILFLKDGETKKYTIAYAATRAGETFAPKAELFDFAAAKECVRYRKWVQTDQRTPEGVRPCLWIPLCCEKECVGLLYLIDCLPMPFERSLAEQMNAFAELSAKAIYNHQGPIEKAKEHQQAETRRAQQMESAGEMKGVAAAKIGHEINNFVAAVNANLELALDLLNNDGETGEIKERILKAQQLLMQIAPLTGGLMCSCMMQPAFEVKSVNQVVKGFIESIKPVYQRTGVKFLCRLQPNLPLLRLDPRLLSQVLFNLCKNAVEARKDAQIVISTRFDACERCILLTIQDNGPGFSPEKLQRLFAEPFTDKANGHGLGLAICRDIIEKHGGSIQAANAECGGACFTIRLPLPHHEDYKGLEFERIEQPCRPYDDAKHQNPRSLVTLSHEKVN